MKKHNTLVIGGAVSALIIFFALLIGPSFNRLFIGDEPVQGSSIASPVITLSVDHMAVNKTSDNAVQLHTIFAAHNPGKNTVMLDNVQYGIYVNNNTKIASGSIGWETDDVIHGQESVYPVIAGDTLRISDEQTLTKSAVHNDETLWHSIVNGNASYAIRGIYMIREDSELQASGNQKDFEIPYSQHQNSNNHTSGVTFVKSLQLPQVQGRIDHMSIDVAGKRLFIAELGNNSVDVINLSSGNRIHSITTGLSEPQGILFVPKFDKIFISNGGDGTVRIYNATSYSLIKSTRLEGDADNIMYDDGTGLIYVGYGDGALAVLNSNGSRIADISLPGHPESFQIEESGNRIFVNVPSDHSIVLADKQAHSVIKKWRMNDASQNFPMALDDHNRRLFVGFRDYTVEYAGYFPPALN